MILYHNPECSKSTAALEMLRSKGVEPHLRLYMEDPLLPDELEDLLDLLDMEPSSLLRKEEEIWQTEFRDLELSEDEILYVLIENPELMQRPIFVNGDRAVVGRPPEKVLEIL